MKGADPYISGHGDLSYAVTHYDLTLAYALPSNKLDGTAVLTCEAVDKLSQVALDLRLKPLAVEVPGHRVSRYKMSSGKVVISLAKKIPAGEEFTVVVRYSGNPAPIAKRGQDAAGWEELEDGVIVASQPHGAPSWFPCNDRVSDKATYALSLVTAADYHVEFSGEPLSVSRRGAKRTWQFAQTEPIPSYLATVQIGRYQVTVQDAVVPMRVVGPTNIKRNGFAASFGRQPEMMACFVEAFGPYPFSGYTAVITDDPLEIPLESASLSTFGRNFASSDWESVRLVAHETAHQWFGNAVTVRQWRDIWLHEGFACYAEWLWSEASGLRSVVDWAREHHGILAGNTQQAPLSDPTPALMFEDWIYKRGALTLHALRCEVGEDTFFTILRSWVATYRGTSVSTADFVAHASAQAGRDLGGFFAPWLDETDLPAFPH